MDCVTPSHPYTIPHGETLDITQLLDKNQEAFLDHMVNVDGRKVSTGLGKVINPYLL
jgi:hypothetical protein